MNAQILNIANSNKNKTSITPAKIIEPKNSSKKIINNSAKPPKPPKSTDSLSHKSNPPTTPPIFKPKVQDDKSLELNRKKESILRAGIQIRVVRYLHRAKDQIESNEKFIVYRYIYNNKEQLDMITKIIQIMLYPQFNITAEIVESFKLFETKVLAGMLDPSKIKTKEIIWYAQKV